MEQFLPENWAYMHMGLIFSITCAQLLVIYVLSDSSNPPAGLGLTGTERGWYRLEIRGADESGYTAIAVPASGSPQARDGRCRRFTIDATGRRGSAPNPPSVCWK